MIGGERGGIKFDYKLLFIAYSIFLHQATLNTIKRLSFKTYRIGENKQTEKKGLGWSRILNLLRAQSSFCRHTRKLFGNLHVDGAGKHYCEKLGSDLLAAIFPLFMFHFPSCSLINNLSTLKEWLGFVITFT